MKRVLHVAALQAVLALLGCTEPAEPTPLPHMAAVHDAPAAEPACDEDAPLPPLPAYAVGPRERVEGWRVEPIDVPSRSACVTPRALLSVGGEHGPLVGGMRGEGLGRRFALSRAHDVAPLGDGFFLSAGDAGLYVHDAQTMARRARLYDAPVVAVATSADATRIATLTAEGALLVVERGTLAPLGRVEDVPRGRLAFSADGDAVAAVGGSSLVWLPLDGSPALRRTLMRRATDFALFAERPGLVALADGQANVSLYDALEGVYRATRPPKKLRAGGDISAVAVRGSLVYAGDDASMLHILDGVLGEAPEERAIRSLDDAIAAIALRAGGGLAVATRSGQLVLSTDGEERARLDPLVLSLLGDDVRLAWVDEDAVVVAFLGELFRFDGAQTLLRAAGGVGHIIMQDATEADLVVAVRMGARTVVHRVEGGARPAAETRVLGELRWADVLGALGADDGSRALLGLTPKGIDAAFIDPDGALISMGQPAMELGRPVTSARIADGRYALWDPKGRVYELDVRAKSFALVGTFPPSSRPVQVRYHAKRGYEVLIDGRRQALASAVPATP